MKALAGLATARRVAESARLNSATGVQVMGADRSLVLDGVKGLLVLLMVLYHWLNYFVTSEGEVYKYLRFITPSFIFVTGFLISNVYLTKYRIGEWRLHGRLLVRGLKLLLLFSVLNLGANLVLDMNYDGTRLGVMRFFGQAFSVYVSGDGRGAAFEVLVPIGYLLVASSFLILGYRLHRHFLLGVWLACVGSVYVLKVFDVGSANVELLSMGLLGMVVGRVGIESIDRVARPVFVWVGAYVSYLVALSVYNVVFEVQVVGLVLNAMLLYIAAKRLDETGLVVRRVIVLGQYSLLAYIAHIAILQALARTMRAGDWGWSKYFVSLGGAVVLTVLAVELTRWFRGHSRPLDRLYRLVFA